MSGGGTSTLIRNGRCKVGRGEAFGTIGDLNRAFRPKVAPLHLRGVKPPAPTDDSTHQSCCHPDGELTLRDQGEEKRESGSFYSRSVLPRDPEVVNYVQLNTFCSRRERSGTPVCVYVCGSLCVCVCVLVSLSSPRALTSITAG